MDIKNLLTACTIFYITTLATADIPTSSLPHAPVNGACDEGEYLDKRHNQCCNRCPPGEFAKVRCSGSYNTKCERCPHHTYTAIPNYSNGCHQCRKCPKGSFDKVKCTGTQNSKCACLPGWYCATDSSQTEDCRDCVPKRSCPCGYFGGIDKLGNPICKSCCVGKYCDDIRNHRVGPFPPCKLSKCN
ncbi:CrmC [Cowpox virus]|uniref:CrmC n=1 Tax=Cowpox virus TaxID=10243 RepID=G0XUW3_COWPX|nr:secreted TNF-receptor-like protein [Cowpox virus]AGY98228.1 CrmC [Cowpox virus]AZY89977.1 CrmC [Cowpox virus]AZY90158.1 CrmC [Cowpox virus]AZY90530.1 CrmC [Cowpox virus]